LDRKTFPKPDSRGKHWARISFAGKFNSYLVICCVFFTCFAALINKLLNRRMLCWHGIAFDPPKVGNYYPQYAHGINQFASGITRMTLSTIDRPYPAVPSIER